MADGLDSLIARPIAFDFNSLADPFKGYQQGRAQRSAWDIEEKRKQTLATLPRNPDGTLNYPEATARLMQIGDLEGAKTLGSLASTDFDRLYKMGTLDIARRSAEEKPTYQVIEDANGNKQIVKLNPLGRGAEIVTPGAAGGATPTPAAVNNPYATGKMQEHEGKSALFADRAASAHEVINKREQLNTGLSGTMGGLAEKAAPEWAFNMAASPERQQLMNAKRSFVNALLRRESGAAINAGEFSSYDKEYFPQPGDDPTVIEQKRLHRAEVIKGLAREGGQRYRPGFDLGPGGAIAKRGPGAGPPAAVAAPAPAGGVPTPPAAAGAPPPGKSPQQIIQEAKAAIARNAPREAVIEQLRAWGINAPGL